MLVALATNIRYVCTQCALHRAMCTHVAVHCARPGVHCVLRVQKCEWPVESHPPARITPPGGNKCRICWVLVSNVMDYEFIVAVNLYYFSVTLSSFIAFVFHIFFLSQSLFFLTPRLLEVCGRSCPALPATTKSSIMTSSHPSIVQGAAQDLQSTFTFSIRSIDIWSELSFFSQKDKNSTFGRSAAPSFSFIDPLLLLAVDAFLL